jgi:hypothetical protein
MKFFQVARYAFLIHKAVEPPPIAGRFDTARWRGKVPAHIGKVQDGYAL